MSIAFSDFSAPNGLNAPPAQVIAQGLGKQNDLAVRDVQLDTQFASNAGFPWGNQIWSNFNNYLGDINTKWSMQNEAERRVSIDAVTLSVFGSMYFRPSTGLFDPGSWIVLSPLDDNTVRLEQNISASGNKVGHGRLDYLVSQPYLFGGNNRLRPGIITEAKEDLGNTSDFGQFQLAAQLATAYQATQTTWTTDFTRGILTNGALWRFYELKVNSQMDPPILTRSQAISYNTQNGQYLVTFGLFVLFQLRLYTGSIWRYFGVSDNTIGQLYA